MTMAMITMKNLLVFRYKYNVAPKTIILEKSKQSSMSVNDTAFTFIILLEMSSLQSGFHEFLITHEDKRSHH